MPEIQPQAPEEIEALITHIQTRYHDHHRQELAALLMLARRVEDVHWGDPDLPQGLADLVEDLRQDLDEHMATEDSVLFPLMLQDGHEMISQPIAAMRCDHEGHEQGAKALAALTTHGFTPPGHACGTWQRLYAGLAKLAADLEHHMYLESDILFPRFERQAQQA
jgi:regulator of cell morphogenesis and NO signaling